MFSCSQSEHTWCVCKRLLVMLCYMTIQAMLHRTVWSGPLLMNKTLSCMIVSFALHQSPWGGSPTSSDEQNIKLCDYFFCVTSKCLKWVTCQFWWTKHWAAWLFLSCYIKLFEVSHLPVLMNKTLSYLSCRFAETSEQMQSLVSLAGTPITIRNRWPFWHPQVLAFSLDLAFANVVK